VHALSVLSFLITIAIIAAAIKWEDGTAILAICFISLAGTVVWYVKAYPFLAPLYELCVCVCVCLSGVRSPYPAHGGIHSYACMADTVCRTDTATPRGGVRSS
jgi:hypothetical protein